MAGFLLIPRLIGGRQAEINTTGGTAQLRIQFWVEALTQFKRSPVFGIGSGHIVDFLGGMQAHNSFLAAYSELGFLGGTLFLGMFFLAFWRMYQLRPRRGRPSVPELERLRQFLLAMTVSFGVSAASLNHTYGILTFAIMGVSAAYIRLADAVQPWNPDVFSGRTVQRLFLVSVAFLVATQLYILKNVH